MLNSTGYPNLLSDLLYDANWIAWALHSGGFKGLKKALNAFTALKLKALMQNIQKLDATATITIKATSDTLPDMGSTAVTDRSCQIRRAARIRSQIWGRMRNRVATLDTVPAVRDIQKHLRIKGI